MRFSGKDNARTLYGRGHEASAERRRTGTDGREEERARAESGGGGEHCYRAQPKRPKSPTVRIFATRWRSIPRERQGFRVTSRRVGCYKGKRASHPIPTGLSMRRTSFAKIRLSLFTVFMAMGSAALAQAAVTTVNSQAAVQALKTAHALLATANRDYDGHRALADQEVRKAITALGYRYRKVRTGVTPAPAAVVGQPSIHKRQADSDAQLGQAQQILQGVLAQTGASHPKAAAHLKAAIVHINTALSVK